MLHQVGVSFDLYYDARKHKIKMKFIAFIVTGKRENLTTMAAVFFFVTAHIKYRGADKSLAQPWTEKCCSDQTYNTVTRHVVQTTGTYSCCLYAISLDILLYVLVAVACFLPGSD